LLYIFIYFIYADTISVFKQNILWVIKRNSIFISKRTIKLVCEFEKEIYFSYKFIIIKYISLLTFVPSCQAFTT